jgi:hypothetical protein
LEQPQSPPLVQVDDDDPVPVFGSWPRIYLAVALTAIFSIAAIGAFSVRAW